MSYQGFEDADCQVVSVAGFMFYIDHKKQVVARAKSTVANVDQEEKLLKQILIQVPEPVKASPKKMKIQRRKLPVPSSYAYEPKPKAKKEKKNVIPTPSEENFETPRLLSKEDIGVA